MLWFCGRSGDDYEDAKVGRRVMMTQDLYTGGCNVWRRLASSRCWLTEWNTKSMQRDRLLGVYFRKIITLEFSKLIIIRYSSQASNLYVCGFYLWILWIEGLKCDPYCEFEMVNLTMIWLSIPTKRLIDFRR